MTDFLTQVSAFLSSPLGTLVMLVLGGVATYLASTLKSKGDVSKKIEEGKAEAANLLNEREAQNLRDREALRKILLDSQNRITQLETSNNILESDAKKAKDDAAEAKRDAASANERAESLDKRAKELDARAQTLDLKLTEAQALINSTNEKLTAREQESEHNRQEIAALTQRVSKIEAERDAALELVKTRNGELAEREQKIVQLSADLETNKQELNDVRERLTRLEKKDTGKLDPANVPDNDPAQDAGQKENTP